MTHNYRVVVVEDDPYAQDLILNLLSRDWRTRVAGEFNSFSRKAFDEFLKDPLNKVDVIVLDTEVPWNPNWPMEAFEIVRAMEKPPMLVLLCTVPTSRFWNDALLDSPAYGGYLVKQEILYSISAAVALAGQGHVVLTESVGSLGIPIPVERKPLILSGARVGDIFTEREREIMRLGIFFKHSQRDMEDELVIGRDWITEVLGSIYDKLQVQEIMRGEIALETLISDKAVLARVLPMIEVFNASGSKKSLRRTPWLNTLAFHLLTLPTIREV